MGEDGADGARYRAFISYSHVDQGFGRRLHRRLERYVVPRRLVGRATARGPTPRRVAPVFRDREELSAANDLTAEVRAALAASGALIVVCSPASAASPWVAREVELFRELHPDRPVLAALAAGEPADAFPPPLTRAGGARVEPLAADFRPHADGPRLGLLKLVAGVLGVGLDELVQRDAQRRLRNVTAVTAGAVAVALSMSALTAYAVVQGLEARRQRAEAEALVEFMSIQLRSQLKRVGRLDILAAANEKTLSYYRGRDIRRLGPSSRARYARILHAMGEDDLVRGALDPAIQKFRAAEAVTKDLVAERPSDPERIWAQAQSEYWVGYHAYLSDDRATAQNRWKRYRDHAARLASAFPENARYRRELGYAEGNLCTLALKAPSDGRLAVEHCGRALAEIAAVRNLLGDDPGALEDLVNRHAWMADAYRAAGDLDRALDHRLAEEKLLAAQLVRDPRNMRLRKAWVVQQRAIAALEIRLGRQEPSRTRLIKAKAVISEMTKFDPENQDWRRLEERVATALAYLTTQTTKREPEDARRAP